MFVFLMVLEGLIALTLIGVVLLQKSDGSGLSGLSGTGSPSGFMSARGAANFLTRATGFLAAAFMAVCLLLASMAARENSSSSIVVDIAKEQKKQESKTKTVSVPAVPVT